MAHAAEFLARPAGITPRVCCAFAGAAADPDGDGTNNYQEFIAETDPKDPRSLLRIFALQPSTGSALPSFESLLGNRYGRYGVEYSDDVSHGNWVSLKTNASGQTDSTKLPATNAAGHPQRFYRVRAQP
jgi:hypothetical protein